MENDKTLAYCFIAMTGVAVASLGLAIKQELQIDKLTRENRFYKKLASVTIAVGAMTPGFKDNLIDMAVATTEVPNDISNL